MLYIDHSNSTLNIKIYFFVIIYCCPKKITHTNQVTTVDMQKPPPDFRTNFEATHPPILIDNGLAILENDKIERHIMKSIPGGYNLFVQVRFSNHTQNCFNGMCN